MRLDQVAPMVPPGTESWAERYGPIGVVAALALAALILAIRQLLLDRNADRQRANKLQEMLDTTASAQNARLVEVVRESNREMLERLAAQQAANDTRYQALLERSMAESRENATALRAQNAAVTDALNGMVKKLSRGDA